MNTRVTMTGAAAGLGGWRRSRAADLRSRRDLKMAMAVRLAKWRWLFACPSQNDHGCSSGKMAMAVRLEKWRRLFVGSGQNGDGCSSGSPEKMAMAVRLGPRRDRGHLAPHKRPSRALMPVRKASKHVTPPSRSLQRRVTIDVFCQDPRNLLCQRPRIV